MTEMRQTDRDPELDRHFAERVSEHYRPKPLEPAQRARLDAELRDRIHRRRRAPIWVPAVVGAGAAAALALAWWASPVADTLLPSQRTPAEIAWSAENTDWETDVLLVDANVVLLEEAYLPGDYEAIALAFIDGV